MTQISNQVNQPDVQQTSERRILIVDDDKPLQDLLELLLSRHGYIVDIAMHGADAIRLTETSKFDLIILDLMMPVMDGIEFLRWLRKRDTTTPVVVFTSLVRHKAHSRIEASYVNDTLFKPVSFEKILEVAAKFAGEPVTPV